MQPSQCRYQPLLTDSALQRMRPTAVTADSRGCLSACERDSSWHEGAMPWRRRSRSREAGRRRLAVASRHANPSRRLLSLAAVLDGMNGLHSPRQLDRRRKLAETEHPAPSDAERQSRRCGSLRYPGPVVMGRGVASGEAQNDHSSENGARTPPRIFPTFWMGTGAIGYVLFRFWQARIGTLDA